MLWWTHGLSPNVNHLAGQFSCFYKMTQTSHCSLNCQYLMLFYCIRHDGQNEMQYSGYFLRLGNRTKKNIFLRFPLAFAKLVCSPVAGVITAVSALRGCLGHDYRYPQQRDFPGSSFALSGKSRHYSIASKIYETSGSCECVGSNYY